MKRRSKQSVGLMIFGGASCFVYAVALYLLTINGMLTPLEATGCVVGISMLLTCSELLYYHSSQNIFGFRTAVGLYVFLMIASVASHFISFVERYSLLPLFFGMFSLLTSGIMLFFFLRRKRVVWAC